MQPRTIRTSVAAGLAVALAAVAAPSAGAEKIGLTPAGVFDSESGELGAEIVAVDTRTDRMFVTNGAANRIDIVDISDPDAPDRIGGVDLSGFGGVQSVAVGKKIGAAAVAADDELDNGSVVVFDTDGHVLDTYEVGNLPDSIAFTPNGRYIVVANEAEPVCQSTTPGDAVDPEGSISIIDVRKRTVATAGFDAWIGQEQELRDRGVRIFFPGSNAAQDLEPEYVTVSNNSRTAYVTLQENNAVAVVDIKRAEVQAIVPLGYQDHDATGNALDPSNRDGGVNIANWDVLGMYQPDAIAFANLDTGKYLLTANEGDARDYDCFSEEIRVGDFDADTEVGGVVPQGLAAPYTADDTDNDRLGRLRTTNAFPTALDDADRVEQVYAYGARSFTIWDLGGNVVFDSGEQFARRLAATPEYFNLDLDDEIIDGELVALPDGRSDDKGAEPEALAVGEVGDRTYAFIGLERSGGVMIYDITDPAAAFMVDYVNTTTFETATADDGEQYPVARGDISPEGISFVPADQSPTGVALIAVSYEVSGTTRLFEVG